ncbi:MAG: 1-acyl-sn-glycerol-3-phosphate acyltransferase [Putridiphycobacter sp.]|nr:1-acyl-sn-glycerol-3-phosphate acyltransferase [Putridiphycobacter sp.]
MKEAFGKFWIKLLGWTIHPDLPPEIHKCILVMAPHTSNWDFFIGNMGFWGVYKIDVHFLIKKSLFIPPLGWILKWMGGIPVDRKRKTNLTQDLKKRFATSDKLTIVVTPEGTRSYNPNWKKGFYYIAKEAGIPIVLGYMDYPSKTAKIFHVFDMTDDVEADIKSIQDLFKPYTGKHPKNGVR